MVRRALVLALVMADAMLGIVLAAPDEDQPLAVVGHTGVSVAPSTTLPVLPTVRAVLPATTPTSATTRVVASRSSTVVQGGGGTVAVVNEGSAVASTGGNTVIGPPDARVTNGPATAVGNVSRP